MARKGRSKPDTRGPLQRLFDRQCAANDQSFLDVLTPEQFNSGRYASGFDGKGKATTTGRRYFRLTHLDRLHKNGKLTYEQHKAGEHYRELWDIGRYDAPRTSDYQRVRGSNVIEFTMPTRREDAREMWRAARREIQVRDVGFADRFLLRDDWPKVHHRASARNLATLRNVLDTLAVHFRFV